jgi:glycine/D-amino acid oxidase-like deaminating enzyme
MWLSSGQGRSGSAPRCIAPCAAAPSRWSSGQPRAPRLWPRSRAVQVGPGRQPRTWLARRSIEEAIHFEEWAGAPLATQRSGSFLVARTPEHKSFLETELAQSRQRGVELRKADAADLAERACYYHPSRSELALWCPEDIYIAEQGDLIQAYTSACQLHGVQILESEAAIELLIPGRRVTGLETTTRRIEADTYRAQIAIAPVRHQLLNHRTIQRHLRHRSHHPGDRRGHLSQASARRAAP